MVMERHFSRVGCGEMIVKNFKSSKVSPKAHTVLGQELFRLVWPWFVLSEEWPWGPKVQYLRRSALLGKRDLIGIGSSGRFFLDAAPDFCQGPDWLSGHSISIPAQVKPFSSLLLTLARADWWLTSILLQVLLRPA